MESRVELILAAAIVHIFVGALWYSPLLFGPLWQTVIKKNPRELQRGTGLAYRSAMISAIVMAYVLARLLSLQPETTLAASLNTVFWIWGGILMPAMLVNHTFAQRPFLLYLIDGSYHLFSLLATAAVLSLGL